MDQTDKIIVIGYYMPSHHNASRICDEIGICPTVIESHCIGPCAVLIHKKQESIRGKNIESD